MSRDPRLRLDDIVQYADKAMAFVAEMSFDAFAGDVKTQWAVSYALLVVGEAAKHVPGAVRARAPRAAWEDAMRFRDRAAHGYDSLKLAVVWEILTRDLPRLRDEVAALIARLDAEDPPPR